MAWGYAKIQQKTVDKINGVCYNKDSEKSLQQ